MPATLQTLTLRTLDNSLVANLLDPDNIQLVEGGWGPRVAQLRDNPFGGRSPYTDEDEAITVNIRGASGTAVLQNVATLQQLCIQARAFDRSGTGQPVVLDVQFTGGAMESVRVRDGRLELPASYNDLLMVDEISAATLHLTRGGALLAAEEATAASSALANPNVLTRTFATSAPLPSPVTVTLGGWAVGATLPRGYLAIAPSASDIVFIEAESTSDDINGIADTTNQARGGSIWRYDTMNAPAGSVRRVPYSAPAGIASWERVTWGMAVRVNQLTHEFLVQIAFLPGGGATTPIALSTARRVPLDTTNPQIIWFPEMARVPGYTNSVELWITTPAAANGPSIDFDYLVALNTGAGAQVVGVDSTDFDWLAAGGTGQLRVQQAMLDQRAPRVLARTTGGAEARLSYTGSPEVWFAGNTVAVAWLATSNTLWRDPATQTLQATRRIASLTPT